MRGVVGLVCSGTDEGLGLEGGAATRGGVENRVRDTIASPPSPPPPSPTPAPVTPCRMVVSEANSLIKASAQRLEVSYER